MNAFHANGGEEAIVLDALTDERVGLVVLVSGPGVEKLAAAARWCRAQRALLVAEVPADAASVEEAIAFAEELAGSAAEASADVALYFPSLHEGSAAGAVAGVIARTPPWVAPAGRDATFLAEGRLAVELRDRDLRALEEAGVNGLRALPDGSRVVWGGRTLSSDPEWKYVSLRRYFAFLEHSIDEGTHWAVFEPNNEPLWRSIRAAVSDFLLDQWQRGAVLGATAAEAFFVRCDRTTMTDADLAAGRLVVVVGVAPLKPAEFVVIELQRFVVPWPPP